MPDLAQSTPDGGRGLPARSRAWALFAVGMLAAFHPVFLSGLDSLQVFFGDPRLVNYVLEHSYRWLLHEPLHGSFWSPPIFYPAQNTGTYTDTMLGAAPFYWCWRALGFDGGLAMQFWIFACFALNFAAALLLLRRACGFSRWPAALGAYLFTFANCRMANFNSPQLFPLFYGVAALALLPPMLSSSACARRTVPCIWLFFGLLSLQAWSAFYPTFFLLLILGATLLVALFFADWRGRLLATLRAHPWAWAAAAAASLVAITPMVLTHLEGASEVGWRNYSVAHKNMGTLASWLFPGHGNVLYGRLYGVGPFAFENTPRSQHSNGLGLVTTLVCLAGLWHARDRSWVRVISIATLLVLLLSTKFFDFAGWRAIYELFPGGKAIRYPARIGMFLTLPGAIGIAFFARRMTARGRGGACAAIMAFCMLEQLHWVDAYPEHAFRRAVREIARHVDPDCEAFYLARDTAAPASDPQGAEARNGSSDPPRLVHLVAMWAALEARKPTLNGFYGNNPPEWSLQQGADGALLRWLRLRDIDPRRVALIRISNEWHPRTHPALEARVELPAAARRRPR